MINIPIKFGNLIIHVITFKYTNICSEVSIDIKKYIHNTCLHMFKTSKRNEKAKMLQSVLVRNSLPVFWLEFTADNCHVFDLYNFTSFPRV